ncbi:MAG: RluA family pseudouridine synthase [Burkholderiaceae bacterium]
MDEASRFVATAAQHGERLDKMLAAWMPRISRGRLQDWIAQGAVLVNGKTVAKPRHSLIEFDEVTVVAQPAPEELAFVPEAMDLSIVYEDASIIVIDKPAGLVVHPGAGNWSGTLLNGLLAHDANLARVPRAGIVHRLDAHTSGLMVVARTLVAQTDLVRQLQARTVKREYWAVAHGIAPEFKTIEAAIERDPRHPLRFHVGHGLAAKPAITHVARVGVVRTDELDFSWVACRLETGRTHQIRVHLESLGLPLVGDPVYRGRRTRPQPGPALWTTFSRQALHASRLGLIHPDTREEFEWFRPPPADMSALMREFGFGPLDRPTHVLEE